MKKIFFLSVLVVMALTGCKQSALNLEDVEETVTISGFLTYEKQVRSGSSYERQATPLTGHEILVRVNSETYSQNSSSYKYFTTKTDYNGKYSIKIPVGMATVNATVYPEQFVETVKVSRYDSKYGEYVWEEQQVTYQASEKNVTLKKGYAPTINFDMDY